MTAENPWEAIDQARKLRKLHAQQKEEQRFRESEWGQAWAVDFKQDAVAQLLRLGSLLGDRKCGFWLDYWEIRADRERYVVERNLRPGYVINNAIRAQTIVTVQILKYAYIADEQQIATAIEAAKAHDGLELLQEKIWNVGEAISEWSRGVSAPQTPFMTRTELARSLEGSLPGFNKSDITKKIEAGELRVEHESEPDADGKKRYAQFCHVDPSVQFKILRHVVAHLKTVGIHSFFACPIWTAETGETGA